MTARDINDIIREDGNTAAQRELDNAKAYRPGQEDAARNVFQIRPRVDAKAEKPLQWLDMSTWDNEPIPQRDWVIPNRVPAEQVGLFSGEGGAGKSIIELTKDVAHVAGKDWFGSLPDVGPAIYIGTEDSEKELHIRLAMIARHFNLSFQGLVNDGLKVLPLLDDDAETSLGALLCTLSHGSTIEPTPLFHQIYEAAGDIKPINISIDPLSSVLAATKSTAHRSTHSVNSCSVWQELRAASESTARPMAVASPSLRIPACRVSHRAPGFRARRHGMVPSAFASISRVSRQRKVSNRTAISASWSS